jgi:DNA topoisomerase I
MSSPFARPHPSRRASGKEAVAPVESANAAGLRYVADNRPGIRRRNGSLGFTYVGPNGRIIRRAADLKRIRALAVPPAWTDVWICPDPRGHIQATGRDAKGRKQYRYHPQWRAFRDDTKYHRMLAFADALARIRVRTEADLARPGLPREKVLAAVVQLLEKSLIRIGNDEYARKNDSFGLTTLRDKHVAVQGGRVRFEFKGKSGRRHCVDINDRRLASIVKRCRDLPGYELFQYVDDEGRRQDVGSADVNAYLKEITGADFTAKDFRTWAGSVLAVTALKHSPPCASKAQAKRNVVRAIEAVAGMLGNTQAVCRKSYVHPAVVDGYLEGTITGTLQRVNGTRRARLRPEEAAVLAILREHRARTSNKRRSA